MKFIYENTSGGGIPKTPRGAADMLDSVGAEVAKAERLHPETQCTEADVSDVEHKKDGLKGGEYACYSDKKFHETKYYQECKFFASTSASVSPFSLIEGLYAFGLSVLSMVFIA